MMSGKGEALAREAYLRRMNDNMELIKKVFEKNGILLSIFLYGLRFYKDISRVYVPATYENLRWLQNDPSLSYVFSTLEK